MRVIINLEGIRIRYMYAVFLISNYTSFVINQNNSIDFFFGYKIRGYWPH